MGIGNALVVLRWISLYSIRRGNINNDSTIVPWTEIEKDQKYALVFGNEVYGVNQKAIEICDGTIEIPQLGTKHSLNIAVSAGIVVWDLFQKMHFAK